MGRHIIGLRIAPLAQAAGQQRIDPHADTHIDGNQQQLHRIHQRQGNERILGHIGYENTVYNIIAALDKHRKNHGPGHRQQQPVDRQRTHNIVPAQARGRFNFFFHPHNTPTVFLAILFLLFQTIAP